MTVSPVLTRRRSLVRAAVIGLVVCAVLIALAIAIPGLTGWNVRVRWFPPLHAEWMPRLGPGTVPAVAIAVLVVAFAGRARDWAWGWLLAAVYATGLVWMLSLALVDGLDGIGVILDTNYEYLQTARAVTDFGATLRGFIERIPLDSVDNWPVHIAGHPPGALLFFVVLTRLGLGSGLAAGFVVVAIAASAAVAVLLTLRALGAEHLARRAAPFLVVGPAAIWMAVSADAVFTAFAAWGILCLAIAATAGRGIRPALWGALSGALLGTCVMFSYGLPLLGVLAVTVLALARSWRPLPWAAAAAFAVVGSFAVAGFAWWEAFPVLQQRYWDGIASRRPASYWMWGNLAALSIAAGPWLGAAVGAAVVDGVGPRARAARGGLLPSVPRVGHAASRDLAVEQARGTVAWLALAGLVMCLLADISQYSRAEVERIWLPFVPWTLVAAALLPARWRVAGLVVQAGFALLVQHLLFTGW